ncbi:hypothetical protein [Agrobacterium tumefaciens]|uniref:hypothetical protein n=1 Tax=Agrobacterium tumefaciens TaxID=358 RepID=UPI00157447C5|nr:hypothetical protein [Agrobacterium tumefaciens]
MVAKVDADVLDALRKLRRLIETVPNPASAPCQEGPPAISLSHRSGESMRPAPSAVMVVVALALVMMESVVFANRNIKEQIFNGIFCKVLSLCQYFPMHQQRCPCDSSPFENNAIAARLCAMSES